MRKSKMTDIRKKKDLQVFHIQRILKDLAKDD